MKKTILLLFILSMPVFGDTVKPEMKYDEFLGYKNVNITRVEPDGLRIMHQNGTRKINFEDLPVDVRNKFRLDEKTALEYRAKMKEIQARRDKAEAKRLLAYYARLREEKAVEATTQPNKTKPVRTPRKSKLNGAKLESDFNLGDKK